MKTQLRDVELHFLCRQNVAPVYNGLGARTTFARKKELYISSLKLRSRKYDAVLVLPTSFSSALSAYLIGAKRRIGFSSEFRSPFLTDPLPFTREISQSHVALQYMRLLEPLQIPLPDAVPSPSLRLDENELEKAHRKVRTPFVAISPFTAFGPSKEWGTKRFLSLAHKLSREGLQMVLMGAPDERERSLEFNEVPGLHNLVGRLTLRESAAILSLCEVLVSNDSGLAHLGASVGARVIVIFGATSPKLSRPLGRHSVIFKPQRCSPCYRKTCRMSSHLCMDAVTVDEVKGEVLRALSDPNYPEEFTLRVPPR